MRHCFMLTLVLSIILATSTYTGEGYRLREPGIEEYLASIPAIITSGNQGVESPYGPPFNHALFSAMNDKSAGAIPIYRALTQICFTKHTLSSSTIRICRDGMTMIVSLKRSSSPGLINTNLTWMSSEHSRYYRALALEALNHPDQALAQYITIYAHGPESWKMLAALHLERVEQDSQETAIVSNDRSRSEGHSE